MDGVVSPERLDPTKNSDSRLGLARPVLGSRETNSNLAE
jgi:hypothetical protein